MRDINATDATVVVPSEVNVVHYSYLLLLLLLLLIFVFVVAVVVVVVVVVVVLVVLVVRLCEFTNNNMVVVVSHCNDERRVTGQHRINKVVLRNILHIRNNCDFTSDWFGVGVGVPVS